MSSRQEDKSLSHVAPPEISLRDALYLALRSWVWLAFGPILAAAAITAIYHSTPVTNRVVAVLNTDLTTVELAIDRMELENRPAVTLSYEQTTPTSGIATAQAMDGSVAFEAIEELIALLPPNKPALSILSPMERMELRAHRQYLKALNAARAGGGATEDIDTPLLRQEIEAVASRIDVLQRRDIPGPTVPVVGRAPANVPSRAPPTRNVLVFSYLFSLFAIWLAVYSAERRRLNR